MIKKKITFALFTLFFLSSIAPATLYKLYSAGESFSITLPKIHFNHSFNADKVAMNSPKSFDQLEESLVKSYQQAAYKALSVRTQKAETLPIKRVVQPRTTKTPPKRQKNKKASELEMTLRNVERNPSEINNNDYITHYGFKAERTQVVSWSDQYRREDLGKRLAQLSKAELERNKMAELNLNNDEVAEVDEVKLSQASSSKSEVKNGDYSKPRKMDDETWEDELVMIDYSEDENKSKEDKKIDGQLTQEEAMRLLADDGQAFEASPQAKSSSTGTEDEISSMTDHLNHEGEISDAVMGAIAREMDKRENISSVATVNTQKDSGNKRAAAATTKKNEYSSPKSVKSNQVTPSNEYSKTKSSGYSRNRITISQANIDSEDSGRELRNFEFFSETLNNDSYVDDSSGVINLDFELNSSLSVIRGTILKRGHMRTKVDLAMEPGDYDVKIPLIEQDVFGRFLDKENIYGRGGYVLVQLPRQADTVELDSAYEAKIHLDGEFKVVEEDEYYEYILFAGVDPGNVLISYENFNTKVADKISHVVEDEVLFEGGIIIESGLINLALSEKNMLSRKNSRLNIHADQINYFNRRTQASQEAVASYSMQTPVRILGMRDYLEFRHSRLPIFAGVWGDEELVLPSEDFARYIMDSHQLRSLRNTCLVQVNLSKPIVEAQFYGETKRGPMGVVQSFLDQDGEFNYDPSEMASHIFLIGDMQGTMSGKVEYADGSFDFIHTFCSENTYLVEQL